MFCRETIFLNIYAYKGGGVAERWNDDRGKGGGADTPKNDDVIYE